MVVFSLGLMSACPEKKKEEPTSTGDTETMEKKDEGTKTEEGTEETDGDAMNQEGTDEKDTATTTN